MDGGSQVRKDVGLMDPQFRDKRNKSGQPADNSNRFEDPEGFEMGVKELLDPEGGPSHG